MEEDKLRTKYSTYNTHQIHMSVKEAQMQHHSSIQSQSFPAIRWTSNSYW